MEDTWTCRTSEGVRPELRESDWKVDPHVITDFDRTYAQCEAFILFAVAVAGKQAVTISDKVHSFLTECGCEGSPFSRIRMMVNRGTLDENLRRVRMGKYTLLGRAYPDLAFRMDLDLRTATEDQLESVPGISSKTARFFTCHSRAAARVGVVDTHMLKYLRDAGIPGVPEGNAAGRHYERLEKAVHGEVERLGMDHADFDQKVWSWYAKRNVGLPPFAKRP